MSKHTPGPWELQNGGDIFSALGADSGDGCKCDANDGWHIAQVEYGNASVGGEVTELGWGVVKANARLIAAAPELLEVLQEVFVIGDRLVSDVYGNEFAEKARAAIAKATGEQQ